jgi:uncharacterized phage protein (TIGR01671 family)
MREIEFRVWDAKEKYMFELDNDAFFINNRGLQKRCHVAYLGDGYVTASDRYILMQYTGLKGRNGKNKDYVKIFEGDIIEMIYRDGEREMGIVEYCESKARYLFVSCDEDSVRCGFDGTTAYVVIGNIYENPELLKEGAA